MRILLLCSSLEPGRDGVGDHVRMLAEACERLGHTCALIALRDPYTQTMIEGVEKGGRPFLRLPSLADSPLNASVVTSFRDRFRPDWISLHLVAYGLHPKGLLFQATPSLAEIVGRAPLQLMLHELWLGNDEVPSWRHRVIGFLQRTSLNWLLSRLRPRLVATSNPVYAALLRTIGVDAEIVPVFGNIPILPSASLPGSLAEVGITAETRQDWWIGLFFGGLYREWQPEPFLSILRRAAAQTGKRICLVLAGNAGTDGEDIWHELGRAYSPEVAFLRLRHQPEAALSALMQQADFGVAASPWSIIGKSGSAAAMLDHGLPVIVTRDDFRPRVKVRLPPSTDPLLHRCDDALEGKLVAGLPRRAPHARVNDVAAMFVAQLERAAA
jgi:glycosyltransferase involved in cell wall biosynthesis